MFIYVFFGVVFSVIAGSLVSITLVSGKKWADSTIFIIAGFLLGLALMLLRYFTGILALNTFNFYLAAFAYILVYYIFYKDFDTEYKNLSMNFFQYIGFMVKNAPILIKDASAEDTLKSISRDVFHSNQIKEITKVWYEDKPEPDAFGGWLVLLWNFLFFTGITVYIASLNSLTDFFYSILFSDEVKLLFWGIIIIFVGIVIKAYVDSKK